MTNVIDEIKVTISVIDEIKVTISDRNRNVSEANWDGAFWHWNVEFEREEESFTVPYYGGSAVEEITEEDVLANCLMDALAFVQADGFEDFCNSFGYEVYDEWTSEESKESKKVYRACKKMFNDFCRILDIADYAFEDVACEWLNEHDI